MWPPKILGLTADQMQLQKQIATDYLEVLSNHLPQQCKLEGHKWGPTEYGNTGHNEDIPLDEQSWHFCAPSTRWVPGIDYAERTCQRCETTERKELIHEVRRIDPFTKTQLP